MSYNGWKNYETWNVALWLDNDSGSYSMTQSMAQEAWDGAEAERSLTRLDVATRDLADSLQALIDEMRPDLGASMFADLLGAALSEVDWYEMAEHYLSDIDKESDDEEESEESEVSE